MLESCAPRHSLAGLGGLVAGALLWAAGLGLPALADSPAPIHPHKAPWGSPPALPGVTGAWLLGAEQQAGLYQFRVRLAPGARIPPHTHPDARNSTVLKGTLYVGFGETFDENALVAIPAGSLYVAPAGKPHYLWARDGAVEYQENGIGPSATRIPGGDDRR